MNKDVLALLIPIIAVGGPFAFLILRTMSRHQLAMAELMQRSATVVDPRVDALQREVAELKDLVHQQTISLDGLSRPLPNAELRERVGER